MEALGSSLSTGIHLAISMLSIIEQFHKAGDVIRVIKPANFLLHANRAVQLQ
jgi:hypothetical protein